MVKITTVDGNVLLGIEAGNIKRLKEGKPIMVKGADIGKDFDIFIMYGDTINDILKQLKITPIQ